MILLWKSNESYHSNSKQDSNENDCEYRLCFKSG